MSPPEKNESDKKNRLKCVSLFFVSMLIPRLILSAIKQCIKGRKEKKEEKDIESDGGAVDRMEEGENKKDNPGNQENKPITIVNEQDEKAKKKKRKRIRRIIWKIILVIIILYLIGNTAALDKIYFDSPVLQSQNITTLVNNISNNTPVQEKNLKPAVCSILLGTTDPKNFSCGNCLDQQSFYNVTTFCELKSIWANTFNKTSIETNLRWMQDVNFCTWGGIRCDNFNNIVELDLEFPNVPFVLDNSLGNLKTLQKLTVVGDGQIPNNKVPLSIFQLGNLTDLALIFTGLTGNIPNNFDKLPNLKSLRIIRNANISGPIPDTISTASLTTLTYSLQNVNGLIPDFIGTSVPLRSNLENLDLSSNQFTGSIPNSLMSLPKLRSLNLGSNNLAGEIPSTIFTSNFTKSLISLNLNSNRFTGTIPTSLSIFENLVDLNLQNNTFQGPIPNEISSMKNLNTIDLGNNRLTGNIPNSIGDINLLKLFLNNNTFTGAVPNNICTRDYQFCSLSLNQFTSPGPGACGRCSM